MIELIIDSLINYRYKEPKTVTSSSPEGVKLVVIAHERAGFSVLHQFLNKETGFFQHGAPSRDLAAVGNLLNCVLEPALVQGFQLETTGEFGNTPYFQAQVVYFIYIFRKAIIDFEALIII